MATPYVDIPNMNAYFYLVIILKLICQRCINSYIFVKNHLLAVKGEYATCKAVLTNLVDISHKGQNNHPGRYVPAEKGL